jgi:ABC-type amino acid transport substrate-binding protein
MSGLVVTPGRATETLLSRSYLDETLGLLVQDADRARFQTWDDVRAAGALTVAVPNLSYYVDKMRQLAPQATIVTVDDVAGAVDGLDREVDAMLLPAERGSAWTLIYPRFSMVVPGPTPIRMPLAYPIARHDRDFANFVDTWIMLKQKDGTIDALYDYWILGRSAARPSRRWSVIKDVLHWEH